MHSYRFADIELASSLELVELPRTADGSGPAVRITRVRGLPDAAGGRAGCHVLRYPGLACFAVSDDGGQVEFEPAPGCSSDALRHLLLDQVLPRVLAHRGRLVLHAGAVEVAGRAVALIGETGRGKSTLVASLHTAGHPALTDDGLVVSDGGGELRALPLYAGLRLWPSSIAGLEAALAATLPVADGSSKRRVPLDGELAPRTLAAVFVLDAPSTAAGEIAAAPMSRRAACVEVLRSAFQLDLGDRQRAAALLDAAVRLVDRVPVLALRYPRDFRRLPEVRAAILGELERLRPPAARAAAAAAQP